MSVHGLPDGPVRDAILQESSAIASGNPRRIARRAKNVTVRRALGRGEFWRWLWK